MLRWLRQFPTDHVHTISAENPPEWRSSPVQFTHHKGESLSELAEVLKIIGPVDVLVDLMPGDTEEHEAIWRALFFHLNPGGVYVVDRRAVHRPASDLR